MRRRSTEQDAAHWLLVRWANELEAALGSEYPPAPVMPTVQGDVAEMTRPESYADDLSDHEGIDRAVRRIAEIDPRLRSVLWQQYVAGPWTESGQPDYRRMAEEMGWTVGHWREWRDMARREFLREYRRTAEIVSDFPHHASDRR